MKLAGLFITISTFHYAQNVTAALGKTEIRWSLQSFSMLQRHCQQVSAWRHTS